MLVTGASRGIGWAITRALVDEGATAWLLARGADALAARVALLPAGRAHALPCDVTDAAAVARAVATVAAATGGAPDILVNNAGRFPLAAVEATPPDEFRASLEANLVAPFRLVHAFLPALRARGRGHVVTIGSVADRTAFPGNAAYAAAKTGLRALHEVLRLELAGSGVRASLVSPGPVDTELWDPIDPDSRPGFPPRAAMLTPEAVAEAVRFVVTCDAAVNVDELRLSRA